MKCPKCRYISFDYNERCPKCNKDLTAEHKKLNIVAFKHNPPFLLAALTGDIGVDLDAISSSDAADISGEDLEMHLDTEILSETEAGEEISLDLQDLGDLADGMTESDESALGSIGGKTQDTLDLGDLSLEESVPEAQAAPEKAPSESAEIITSEIDKEKLRVSKAQDDAEVELDLEELEELEDESS